MKVLRLKILFIMIIGIVILGCQTSATTVKDDRPAAAEEAAKPAEAEDTGGAISEEVVSREMAASFKKETGFTLEDIYFDYDRYNIKGEERIKVTRLSDWMIQKGIGIVIEGHCDERGTKEYNLALGDRRASSVRDFLISSGVPSSRIETVSYGEEKPQCMASAESCWWKNRRAHFILTK